MPLYLNLNTLVCIALSSSNSLEVENCRKGLSNSLPYSLHPFAFPPATYGSTVFQHSAEQCVVKLLNFG